MLVYVVVWVVLVIVFCSYLWWFCYCLIGVGCGGLRYLDDALLQLGVCCSFDCGLVGLIVNSVVFIIGFVCMVCVAWFA